MGKYIIYHYPTPGVGSAYQRLVFTHSPTGLMLDFHFHGETMADAILYYSDIVSTIECG